MEKLNIKNQDLLEAIYEMEVLNGKARLTDVAAKLEFSKSRANQEVKKLKSMGLVVEEKYGPLQLTDLGKFEAERVVFTHQLIKTFLIRILNVEEDVAEKDACAIEHVISEETIQAIVNQLEKVTDSIGEFSLKEAEGYLIRKKRLSELKMNKKAKILKIQGGREMKKRLMEIGVIKGEIVQLVSIAPFGDPLEFAINDFKLSLRLKEIDNIIVELLEEELYGR
ncbi:hypothetical protein AZF37_08880 [endosymbiont 'TC1' of Trimyema compressum]|uniref:metal-dependent transcriptional regulator n=1 Tax=endosymbiont 'TC1' of Trimyema compressum TaxID=243899 RepID=UPI0007F1347A|nr:DtxR family transcriptional regulator [endosymbiont 'TC1' of Trimyema compressum]AMP21241.1 hypothetical protein AZF37_08880 [endosymbiont 'TC1' of Trimyema compressum]